LTPSHPAAADVPPLTYLTFDSVVSGVAASQVLPYVQRLAGRGLQVRLHSYEPAPVDAATRARHRDLGITWFPHRFRPLGPAGGALRLAQGAVQLRGAELVHARSDLAAGSAMLARRPHWIWDVRSFWVDQRIAMGMVRSGSAEERAMRRLEHHAARRSASIITLTEAAIPVLQERHGAAVARKAHVISTCVDLARFPASPMPTPEPLRILLSGSFNTLYDLDTSLRLVDRLRARRPVELTVLTPDPIGPDHPMRGVDATVGSVPFSRMPDEVGRHHVGFAICKPPVGVELRGAAPTKVAEFLACGRVVVVNADLGDMGRLVTEHDCGVALADSSDDELERATAEIERLVADPAVGARCRALAEERFNLDHAIDTLLRVYRGVTHG
jgi:glycosyltransferase involved in cell wall biosynthesis